MTKWYQGGTSWKVVCFRPMLYKLDRWYGYPLKGRFVRQYR